ncbi:MAG: thioredoxin family protein [Nevskiales bacterium]|nr:thioredoxin family protein [Nevskiales bacterium]
MLALCASTVHSAPVRNGPVEAELVAERTAWRPGMTNEVALRLKPDQGWHTYWRNPGDSGLPTTLQWTLPAGWTAGDMQWPFPQAHRLGDLVNYGYGEETLHPVSLEVPVDAEGKQVAVRAQAKWLACSDICIPGQAELSLSLPVSRTATPDPVWAARFEDTRRRLPQVQSLSGQFAIHDGEWHLAVIARDQALAGARRVEFFPYALDLVNYSTTQRTALGPQRARFSQPLSDYYVRAPDRVEGVLVVHGPAISAYTVHAEPGEVAAVDAFTPPAFWQALAFALLGGLILNLMPCVFPVLSIKAVALLESRTLQRAGQRRHALVYAAGVILSCLALAAVLVALRAGGAAVGWGFQLQSPVFIAALVYLMVALGLSLSGMVPLGTRLMGLGQSLTERNGDAGSFFTGVLAVVVASPCTVPFMGAAMGFALSQPAVVALTVFAALGFGLALPFLLLGFFPGLGRVLPRPGAWMETFKQLMAFPLYLTGVWLLWVLGRQTGINGVALVLLGLVLLGFALWLCRPAARGPVRRVLAVLAVLAALGVLAHPELRQAAIPATPSAVLSGPYSDTRLTDLRAQHRPVFVNVTADWCVTCKVNEAVALENEAVRRAFVGKGIVWLTADWTRSDPAITVLLARFGRNGVPLYLLYPPAGEPVVLPQILTPGIVLDALKLVP